MHLLVWVIYHILATQYVMQKCATSPCAPEVRYETSEWGACSVDCDGGVKERICTCIEVLAPNEYAHVKPLLSQLATTILSNDLILILFTFEGTAPCPHWMFSELSVLS